MKSTAWVALLGLVVLVAGGRLLWFYRSKPEPGEPVPHFMPVACEACGKAYADTVGRQPTECRYCKKRAAWRAQKCFAENCGVIFPVIREKGAPIVADTPRCPKCGSTQVGQVPPNEVLEP